MDIAPPVPDSAMVIERVGKLTSGTLTRCSKRPRTEAAERVVAVRHRLSRTGYGGRSGTTCLLETCTSKIGRAKILCDGCNRSFCMFHEGYLDAHLSTCQNCFQTL
jgi:hypothetical protein